MRPPPYQSPGTLPPPDGAGVITLDQVRPQPRPQNEYVDTPRTPLTHSGLRATPLTGKTTHITRERVVLPNRTPSTQSSIIRTQPVSISPPLKKDFSPPEVVKGEESIYCSQCGKCKCGACTTPRELPSRWLCGDKINVSPEKLVEYCTCLCCVKGLFYHCSKDEQDAEYECVSDPCACYRPHCCKRWTCILAMSVCLPCLCLYLPAKCGLMACTACYNKCCMKGCSCRTTNSTNRNSASAVSRTSRNKLDPASQYRGLLVESDRESSSVSTS